MVGVGAAAGVVLGAWTPAMGWGSPEAGESPLSGPKVGEGAGRGTSAEPGLNGAEATPEPRTLVRVGYDGKVKELDRPVEAAALDAVELTEQEREAAEGVLAAHARVWDGIVRTRLVDLSRLDGMLNAEAVTERVAGLRLAVDVLRPVQEFGAVRKRVAEVLGEEAAREYLGVIREYEAALYESRRAEAGELSAAAFRMERRIAGILQQLELAFERTLGADEARFERQLAALDLTPVQEQRIRGLLASFFERYPMGGPPEAERELIVAVAAELTLAQRVKFLVMAARGEE
jgi:hypothetical protein